ncbi:MAG: phosphate acyltransferase, partial [Porticoccaceae bacterium]|nr:phosphate acyltransferase [Porticoccaceae bacterium]
MTCSIRIAVDAMGGEFGPRVTVSALLACLARHLSVTAVVFGDRLSLEAELSACTDSSLRSRIDVRHTDISVSDHDK